MIGYILRRLVALVLTLLAAAVVIFVVLEILPGDPAAVTLGLNAAPEALTALRAEMGLDKPAALRFFIWLGGLVTGDLGQSYTYRVPVLQLITERMAVTLPLALMAIALATAIGIPLGMLAASRHGRLADAGVMAFAQAGLAIPNFWFGLLLVLVFAVGLGWLPAGGFPGWQAGIGVSLKALLMPALALALPQAAIIARVTRSSMLDTLQEDFVRTARAKGLSEGTTMRRHALRNALIPVVTILGLQFSVLIAGAIIIENVFALPGLGRLVFQAIAQHDLIVVKDLVMLFAGLAILINFAVELLYGLIDPRLRQS
ncbi:MULTISPECIES: ABC transporter permease [Bosea]|uniref:Peptide/nickel transport system permease protein n=1 Tax=Bosea robiniae TaxID=1036780 RepID=A0ABY0P3U8_9HYPH|nr:MULTISPECIES: ABC transporter permease [Bosea]TQI74101.1 peptide/nickel transport system permease protein [Bosea sp. AK1]SDH17637.1 peptide/nickel transport system permease protein [Bosea robiniae]